ncbi:MAG: circularly permuted type 2 ATP-grasp protein, partial [Frankiales bacterium]|nr:circularly permuted type 2 ATP-grasp protein [Frankiales bacterium]
MVDGAGKIRRPYRTIEQALGIVPPSELESRANALLATFADRGVTFAVTGGDEERPFPLDLVPRVISADEWQLIDRGVQQRVRALEAFLSDVYGEGTIFRERRLPRRLVTSSRHFHRAAHGISPPNGVRIHVAGIDLVRDATGEFRVLEDNVRVPSGVSYVIENRRAMSRVLPDLMQAHRLRPVSGYPTHLLDALRRSAPDGVAEPTVVVLTPGAYNSAYFEHSLLARLMGVELVEGRDLHCRGDRVFMRTTAGEQQVHVIYRRIDDDFLDPLHFRPESVVGCAGLLNAARAGNVVIANAVGNGVADDKLTYTYVPEMVRFYLDEEPLLRNVDTYRLEEPEQLAHVLAHLDELVVKPVDASGGYGIVIGPDATKRQLAQARKEIQTAPRRWIAQPVVQLSTVPTFLDGKLVPRHVDLRPFAVNNGERVWVLPGGLTRVALPEGSLIVNSSQGGGSKDTWVLAGPHRMAPPVEADLEAAAVTQPAAAVPPGAPVAAA